jgi:hypothetical protein
MQPRRPALAILVFIGVLATMSALLGNIVASLAQTALQNRLGEQAWIAWVAIVVLFVTITAVLLGFELRDRLPAQTTDRRVTPESRHRQAMLAKVRKNWITDVLQPSLFQDTLLVLGLTEQTTAVVHRLDLVVQRPERGDRPLPPGTAITEVFDQLDRALLILGAPGAGKTTLLLELTRSLLDRAAQDTTHPIPVVFPLSTWAEQRLPLADWLVDALHEQYDVPRTIGQAWVDAEQVLPLLDGLDEVNPEHRAACIDAINYFRQDHGLLPLVVSSRTEEYKTLTSQLRLQGAVVIQPLTREQVDAHLTHLGQPMAAVRQALQEDPTLWELLDTPLMLHIVSLTYAGQPVGPLRMPGTADVRRQQLFAAYVDRMFRRRSPVTPYTRQQTEHWLAWLAWQMGRHSQSVFYLERMQPDWLPLGQRWIPTEGVAWGVGLLVGLGTGLGGGLVFGLLAGLLAGLAAYSWDIIGAETVHWSWLAVRSGLSFTLLPGLYIGLGGGLLFGLLFGPLAGLAAGLGLGLYIGLLAGLPAGLDYGGRTCLQHVILRLFLVRNGSAPWRYVQFLDYAAERIFLRKVGGGYRFIHQRLQDYFARLHTVPEDATHKTAGTSTSFTLQ